MTCEHADSQRDAAASGRVSKPEPVHPTRPAVAEPEHGQDPATRGNLNTESLMCQGKEPVNTPEKTPGPGPVEKSSGYPGSGEIFPAGELPARYELTIVTGDRAREWELQQSAAIRELLLWLNNYARQDQRDRESA